MPCQSGDSPWAARLRAADKDEQRLDALVGELTALARDGADGERDRVCTAAARELLQLSFDNNLPTEVLLARGQLARQAVARQGTAADRMHIEGIVGSTLYYAGRYRDACTALRGAIEHAVAAKESTAALLVGVAECEIQLADYPAALTCLQRVEAEPGADAALRFHETAADAYLCCGLLDLVPEHLAAVDRLAPPGDDDARRYNALRRVNFLLATQDFDAVVELTAARLASTGSGDERAQLLVRQGVARSERARGTAEDGGASSTLTTALATPEITPEDATTAELVLADVALRAGRLEHADTLLAAARRRLDARTANGPAPRPDEWALFLAEEARLALARSEPPSELRLRCDRLRAAFERVWAVWETGPTRTGGLGFLCYGTQRFVVSELMRLEMALAPGPRGDRNALAVLIRAQGVGRLARAAAIGVVDVERVVARLLSEHTGLLVWLPSMDRSHLFVVDRDGIESFALAGHDALQAAAVTFASEMQTPPSAATAARRQSLNKLAQQLTDAVLPPRARARVATWTGLYVCGADLVGDLPVESLRLDDGREIGQAQALSYLPSLPAGVWLAERAAARAASPAGCDLVLVADPSGANDGKVPGAGGTAPIALTDDDLEALVGAFDPPRTHVVRGPAAVPSVLASAVVRDARMLAVLAHGRFRPRLEHAAGLALAPEHGGDGVVSSEFVESTQAPAFVALYACGTARGRVRFGDDVGTHLGSAFLTAGADSVLVSRGDVMLSATLAIARVLHARLRAGDSPAEALRRARVDLASRPETSDPIHRSLLRIDGLGLAGLWRAQPTASGGGAAGYTLLGWATGAAATIVATFLAVLAMRRRQVARS